MTFKEYLNTLSEQDLYSDLVERPEHVLELVWNVCESVCKVSDKIDTLRIDALKLEVQSLNSKIVEYLSDYANLEDDYKELDKNHDELLKKYHTVNNKVLAAKKALVYISKIRECDYGNCTCKRDTAFQALKEIEE